MARPGLSTSIRIDKAQQQQFPNRRLPSLSNNILRIVLQLAVGQENVQIWTRVRAADRVRSPLAIVDEVNRSTRRTQFLTPSTTTTTTTTGIRIKSPDLIFECERDQAPAAAARLRGGPGCQILSTRCRWPGPGHGVTGLNKMLQLMS